MTPGKRSNPAALLKQREAIVKDLEERENVPQSERMFPNLAERIYRVTGKPLMDAIERKRLRQNPPPVRRGGKVVGFKTPDSTA